MTPRLILEANMIFSRRGIRRDQMNIQGKMEKKKSQALDHPPRPMLMGWIWMFHTPGVLNGSQLAFRGVVWFQSMTASAIDVPAVTMIRIQSAAFCARTWTTRSKKNPIDSLAMAFPVTANVLAT